MRPSAARVRARSAVVLASAAATALGLVLVPPAAAAAPTPPVVPDSAPDETAASLAARQGGKSVRVDNLTDETTEVRANPDGTFTMTQHVRPVRVKQNGDWTPVDTTLVERPDGTVAPRATVVDLALSGGGDADPLVVVEENGAEVGLVWPDALPRPALDGPTATYPEVMPGVDLKVTADVTGFSQVLVVKDRKAAKNPALKSIAFGSHTKNTTVKPDKGRGAGSDSDLPPAEQKPADGLKATDPDGNRVFAGDATRMWDSAGEATPAERLDGSGTGANTARMDTAVSPSGVIIEPDADFLADPDTVYPVYLDPSYDCTAPTCGKAHHAVVQSAWPDALNYNRTDGQLNDLKAGYYCEGECFIARTYLGMKTASLGGKYIHSAVLNLDVIKSAECGNATPTELWRSNSINSNFTWRTQQNWGPGSGWGAKLSTGNVTNNPTYCPGATGMDLDAKPAIVDAAANGWDVTTFMLKGSNESNFTSWRRFGLNPYLQVGYNSKPNAPTEMGITPSSLTLPCTIGAGRSFINTRTPRLRARVSDPDGGTLSAGFRVFSGPASNYTGPIVDTTDSSTGSGLFAEVTLPSGRISADGVHTWHLWSSDGQLTSWSPNCEMHVDTVAPANPVVTSEKYPSGRPAGGVGVASTFTFSPPATDPQKDIDYYLYGFTNQGGVPATKVNPATLNAPATVSWTPSDSGPQVLSVKAVDRAGNVSALVEYRFEVSDYKVGTSGKVAHWSFEDSLADTGGSKTLGFTGPYPTPYFDAGANDAGRGVHLLADSVDNGEHLRTPDALVRSDRAFTVSAWAKLASTSHDHSVLSHDGNRASVVDLRYSAADNAWAAVVTSADTDTPTATKIVAPAAVDQWTHLTAVYDPSAGNKLSLYVDGVLASDTTVTGGLWNAVGPFVIGAAKAAGARTNHFTGAIDAVRVHDRALTAGEVAGLHSGTGSAAPVAEYLFEDNLLNTGANHDLSWTQAAAYGTGYASKSVTLDRNVAGRPKTSGPVINTAADFSVTAWVKLKDKERHYAVVSQDGVRRSGFLVRYAPDVDRWIFGLVDRDADDGVYQWAIGTSVPATGVWTHIAAIHDATNNKIRLYVNGVLETERDQTPPTFSATGPFAVGNYWALGAGAGHLNGDIDEVAAYDGVLKASEVADAMNAPVERARYKLDETAGTAAADAAGGPAAEVHGSGITWGYAGGRPSAQTTGAYVEDSGTVVGAGPLAAWGFNDTTTDYTGNGRDLSFWNSSGPTPAVYGPGRAGNAAVLDGVNQRLYRSAPVVDTSGSFTITARVKLTKNNNWFTVASQDGTRVSPFVLQYSPDDRRWAFVMTDGDRDNPAQQVLLSKHDQVLNQWADLMAVYDADADMMRLYVGGALQAEKPFSAAWKSTGSFALGRVLWNGVQTNFFPGSFDEVRVYGRALTATDALTMWDLGTSISAPSVPQLRTDQSFTVSTWVRRDFTQSGGARSAVSIEPDGRYSPFILGYRHEWDRFGVLLTSEAADGTTQGWWVLSDKTASQDVDADGWVHLTVVYDAPRKLAKLYVNGVRQFTVPNDSTTTRWDANTGSAITVRGSGRNLVIGRSSWHGVATDYWKGSIRDVRMFSGALPEACDSAPWCTSQLPVL